MLKSDLVILISAVVALIHTLGVLSAIHAVARVRTPQGAIAWAISLLTFPYIALPLYWILGRNHFHGYVEALQRGALEQADRGGIAMILERLRDHQVDLSPERAGDLQVLAPLSRVPYTQGNVLELLVDGEATFDAIFTALEAAERYILIQFFIIKDDDLGRELHARLLRKAAVGVSIRVLYDEIGSHALPKTYIETLRAAGIAVSAFHTTRGRRNRFQLNFRNHRKIVVLDGRVAFVGGLNVGDEYLGRGPLGHWRDTHLRVRGPVVQALQRVFLADWYWATRQVLDLEWRPTATGDQIALIFPTGPADALETCSMFFHQAIVSARRRLWIASPYFVPDPPVFEALQLAALRGVDVRILLPAQPDHKLVYLASFSFLDTADRTGIQLYRYQNGFLHQKVVLVDDEVAAVGTANLDNRSLRLNFEVMAVGVDRIFAGQVAAMLEQDFQQARRTSAADLRNRSGPFRWAVRAARLFDPIL
ncbi:MAG TPA: cardiolipin synthase [Candidatus Competibacteraceae bacterium]|nr:cardiolipin synthase [Candidatus Competibacteraceae bacterium]HRZ07556.1 cardiolipin synthase [Candidatus Competibacteraceae bacterium]